MLRGSLKAWRPVGIAALLALAGLIVVPALAGAQSTSSRERPAPHSGQKPTVGGIL